MDEGRPESPVPARRLECERFVFCIEAKGIIIRCVAMGVMRGYDVIDANAK